MKVLLFTICQIIHFVDVSASVISNHKAKKMSVSSDPTDPNFLLQP